MLRDALTPTPGVEANETILRMLARFPSFGAGEVSAAMMVGLYAEDLAEVPTWAIDEARRRFVKRQHRCGWKGPGAPSSSDVLAEAKLAMLDYEAELGRLDAILDAHVVEDGPTEGERVDAVAHWEAVKRKIVGHADVTPADARREAQHDANQRALALETRAHGFSDGRLMIVRMRESLRSMGADVEVPARAGA